MKKKFRFSFILFDDRLCGGILEVLSGCFLGGVVNYFKGC